MTRRLEVTVIRTGLANLASVRAAFERLDCDVVFTADPCEVVGCPRVVLPGVGAFGPGMATLQRTGLDDALRTRCAQGRPILAICLGLQLLTEGSDEAPGVAGVGLVRGRAEAFAAGVRVPQIGWNTLRADPSCALLEDGAYYFANSFAVRAFDPDTAPSAVWGDHGGAFVGAFEAGPILACQFHPELSGAAGHRLLGRWLHSTADSTTDLGATR